MEKRKKEKQKQKRKQNQKIIPHNALQRFAMQSMKKKDEKEEKTDVPKRAIRRKLLVCVKPKLLPNAAVVMKKGGRERGMGDERTSLEIPPSCREKKR